MLIEEMPAVSRARKLKQEQKSILRHVLAATDRQGDRPMRKD